MKKVLKITGIYISVLSFLVLLLFLSMLIPHKYVAKHAEESITYSHQKLEKDRITNVPEYKASDDGDLRYSEMVYLIDNHKPLKSMIEMNANISGYYKNLEDNNYTYQEYSRYWHGPILYLRVLMIFTNIKNIYLINRIITVLLILIFVIYFFKMDKVFSISFLITSIAFSLIFVGDNISYFNMILISITGSIILTELYKRKKESYEILFVILGLLTSFFDFYTLDVLTLTIPLLVLAILNKKDEKELKIKTVLKYILLWFISYLLTCSIKWLIDYFYLGSRVLKDVLYRANVESYSQTKGLRLFTIFNENLKLILPFYYIKNYWNILFPLLLIFVYNLLFHAKIKQYKSIYIIMTICILRLVFVSVQSIDLTFTTFRILIPIFLVINYVLLKQCINIYNSIKK